MLFWKRKKLKMNHDAKTMYGAFGLTEERAYELIAAVVIEWEKFLVGKEELTVSMILENALQSARNKEEELFISFIVGVYTERYRLALALAENEANKSDMLDDRTFI